NARLFRRPHRSGAGAGKPCADRPRRGVDVRGGGLFASGDRARIWPLRELLQIAAGARARAAARVARAPGRETVMHTDLESQAGLRRLLRALPEVAQQPYGFHEFERRALERERVARDARGSTRLLAAAIVAVAVIAVLWRLTALAPEPLSARGVAPT